MEIYHALETMEAQRAQQANGSTRGSIRAHFVYLWFGTFLAIGGTLQFFGLVPEVPAQADVTSGVHTASSTVSVDEEVMPVYENSVPVRIAIESIGVATAVVAPTSSSIEVLDRALTQGAVQYPGSPNAGHAGNMLLFGHSSNLPLVHNKAYQAFNALGEIEHGARIEIFSETHRYVYEVDSVRLARANEIVVSFESVYPQLTLATCNTFGAKDDRYVVTAHLTNKEPLSEGDAEHRV